jgi:hypothetical protein
MLACSPQQLQVKELEALLEQKSGELRALQVSAPPRPHAQPTCARVTPCARTRPVATRAASDSSGPARRSCSRYRSPAERLSTPQPHAREANGSGVPRGYFAAFSRGLGLPIA